MFAGLVHIRRLSSVAVAAVAGAVAVPAILAAGCGTTASANHPVPKMIVVRDNANGRTISMRVGESLELILSSSYWNVGGSSASGVLRQDGTTVLLPRPAGCPDIPGLGCTPERTSFRALAGGQAVITASRTSCGEALRCVGKATRFAITVVVTPA
jgi:hypothetical protein